MVNFPRLFGQTLAAGFLALALVAPGQAFAQASSTSTSTTYNGDTTTTTTTTYYPYTFDVLGYDASQPILMDRFGYGSERDLLAYDGGYRDDMMQNRVVVHLRNDALFTNDRMNPGINDMQRGMTEGLKVDAFDPAELEIETGTTVTFWADSGHHALECHNHDIFPGSIPLTTGQIYSYTFLEPGYYRIRDGFLLGPSNIDIEGLMIRVKGHSKTMADVYPGVYGYVAPASAMVLESTDTTTETAINLQTKENGTIIPFPGAGDSQTGQAPPAQPTVESDVPTPAPAPASKPVRVRDSDSK